MRLNRVAVALTVAFPCVLLSFSSALAQTAPNPSGKATGATGAKGVASDSPRLESVVVKASKLPAEQQTGTLATGLPGSWLDTPFSTSKVGAALLQAQGGTSLQDALRNVPGVQADSGFNGSHTQFYSMRGTIADNGTGSSRVLR